MPLDDFLEELNIYPQHIKIDVDGNEFLILSGAKRALTNKLLKTILIELDLDRPDYSECLHIIQGCGLVLEEKTVSEMYKNSVSCNTLNHIFVRQSFS